MKVQAVHKGTEAERSLCATRWHGGCSRAGTASEFCDLLQLPGQLEESATSGRTNRIRMLGWGPGGAKVLPCLSRSRRLTFFTKCLWGILLIITSKHISIPKATSLQGVTASHWACTPNVFNPYLLKPCEESLHQSEQSHVITGVTPASPVEQQIVWTWIRTGGRWGKVALQASRRTALTLGAANGQIPSLPPTGSAGRWDSHTWSCFPRKCSDPCNFGL